MLGERKTRLVQRCASLLQLGMACCSVRDSTTPTAFVDTDLTAASGAQFCEGGGLQTPSSLRVLQPSQDDTQRAFSIHVSDH